MAFITGLFLIDAPASALNNGEADNIESRVKTIRAGRSDYPYVSAQSFRYWLRTTLGKHFQNEWQASPVYTETKGKQQAFTEGDPISYADDDLFGYMRAEKNETVTRVSPFRTGTLVSIAPVNIVSDFGVMARLEKKEGDKEGVLLHQHQFYRTTLQGLFSIDLNAVGTFTNQFRSGFQNLGEATSKKAYEQGLEKVDDLRAYRLPVGERIRRVQVLLRALARVEGGAKQALHYTDVNPAFVIAAVTRGGNHAFGHCITTDDAGLPVLHGESLDQAFSALREDFLSGVYAGRTRGFMDSSQATLDALNLTTLHPREALDALANDLTAHPEWFD
jgi:CRISPR-associated protein Cst2